MSCRIADTTDGQAILYCSTTDWAFGPLFASHEEAAAFCAWLREHPDASRCHSLILGLTATDPRSYTDNGLEAQVADFRMQPVT